MYRKSERQCVILAWSEQNLYISLFSYKGCLFLIKRQYSCKIFLGSGKKFGGNMQSCKIMPCWEDLHNL